MANTFALDEYLTDCSHFKIGIEFERSDEEIMRAVESEERQVSILSAHFFGYTFLQADGEYLLGDDSAEGKERYSASGHPLVHLDSIVTTLPERLTPEPDFNHFLANAEDYFFGSPEDCEKAKRFNELYQIARNTGVHLNVAVMSPDMEHVSLIWYDSGAGRIRHQEVPAEMFREKVLGLGRKLLDHFDGLNNIDRSDAYQRLADACANHSC